MPESVMILAAGFGTRMQALTATRPKPMILVAGRPLIDHALRIAAHVPRKVVNLHYRGEMIEAHLKGQGIDFAWENEEVLETGGGLKAARPLLGPDPTFVLNSDVIFTGPNPLRALAAAWDPDRMDALLCLLPIDGPADFAMDGEGRLTRHAVTGGPGYRYVCAQITKTERLDEIPDRVFSLNRLWDLMIADQRLFGLVYEGGWLDVGRPEAIAEAEALLREAGDV